MTFPVLHTDRLTMRLPEAGDAGLYQAFFADAEGSGNYGGPLRPDQAWRVLAQDLGHWHLKGFGKWVLVLRETGELLGGCGLNHPEGWPSHELTWWLLGSARGKGFATEASRAAITFAYDTLGWPVVETHMRDHNTPARAIAERLGGVVDRRETFPDGVARDIFRLPRPADEVAV
ncbi:GNAT family N-acetyltransferase [Rhodobacteraceae bacterium NNCM2]|nr:GNAT family N-acetyltransferase [Coraliihabitans acroporae]